MNYQVWAPLAERVELLRWEAGTPGRLETARRETMRPLAGGVHESRSPLKHDERYALSLDGGPPLPDPRSRHQPDGVHSASRWVESQSFTWQHRGFQAVPLTEAVIYELHIGTFSPEGTFDSAIDKLAHLVQLGVTHVEVMPVAAFPGSRGWGYDGVSLFAPHHAYGGPDGFKRFIDACHGVGLAVLLDVVYNHLGPSGNYLGQFGPYFSRRYHTPWGEAINVDGSGSDNVRRFICDNALYWLRDYRLDGLRLDAVHEIYDSSARHILEQLNEEVEDLERELKRPLVLIAESASNDPRNVISRSIGGHGLSSQWSDDFHHALHAVLAQETSGYYQDFGRVEDLADALSHGFVFRGQYSPHRRYSFGRGTEGLRRGKFVVFSQNHDQVGNRATGDRLSQLVSPGRLQIAAMLTLLSPFVPLLFMGEEWGSKRPFQYFTNHTEPDLARAVSEGRRREFESFGWSPDQIPDPQAESTFERSKLGWSELAEPEHQKLLNFYRSLTELRRLHDCLRDDRPDRLDVTFREQDNWVAWRRGGILMLCYWGSGPFEVPAQALGITQNSVLEILLASDDAIAIGESSVSVPAESCCALRISHAV